MGNGIPANAADKYIKGFGLDEEEAPANPADKYIKGFGLQPDEPAVQPPPQAPPVENYGVERTGYTPETPVTGLGAGLYSGGKQEVPRLFTESAEFATGKTGFGAEAISPTKIEPAGEMPYLTEQFYRAGEMAPVSYLGGAALAAGKVLSNAKTIAQKASGALATTGAALSFIPNPIAKGAGKILQAIGYGLPLFYGLQQAQQTKETALQKADEMERRGDITGAQAMREKASGVTPYLTGTIEALGETIGTMALGKLFKPLNFAKGGTVKDILRPNYIQMLKKLPQALGVEIGTEIGQAVGEAGLEKYMGIRPEADLMKEAKDVIVPTAIMTILGGAAAHPVHRYYGKMNEKILTDPDTSREALGKKAFALSQIHGAMVEDNPAVADMWLDIATRDLQLGRPINIDQVLTEDKLKEYLVTLRQEEVKAQKLEQNDPAKVDLDTKIKQYLDMGILKRDDDGDLQFNADYEWNPTQMDEATMEDQIGRAADVIQKNNARTLGQFIDMGLVRANADLGKFEINPNYKMDPSMDNDAFNALYGYASNFVSKINKELGFETEAKAEPSPTPETKTAPIPGIPGTQTGTATGAKITTSNISPFAETAGAIPFTTQQIDQIIQTAQEMETTTTGGTFPGGVERKGAAQQSAEVIMQERAKKAEVLKQARQAYFYVQNRIKAINQQIAQNPANAALLSDELATLERQARQLPVPRGEFPVAIRPTPGVPAVSMQQPQPQTGIIPPGITPPPPGITPPGLPPQPPAAPPGVPPAPPATPPSPPVAPPAPEPPAPPKEEEKPEPPTAPPPPEKPKPPAKPFAGILTKEGYVMWHKWLNQILKGTHYMEPDGEWKNLVEANKTLKLVPTLKKDGKIKMPWDTLVTYAREARLIEGSVEDPVGQEDIDALREAMKSMKHIPPELAETKAVEARKLVTVDVADLTEGEMIKYGGTTFYVGKVADPDHDGKTELIDPLAKEPIWVSGKIEIERLSAPEEEEGPSLPGMPEPKKKKEKVKTLENIGKKLKRWWDDRKEIVNRPDATLADIYKTTDRAKLFKFALGDGATPGLARLVDTIRGATTTFKDYLIHSQNIGNKRDTQDERINKWLEDNKEEKMAVIRTKATEYIENISKISNVFTGQIEIRPSAKNWQKRIETGQVSLDEIEKLLKETLAMEHPHGKNLVQYGLAVLDKHGLVGEEGEGVPKLAPDYKEKLTIENAEALGEAYYYMRMVRQLDTTDTVQNRLLNMSENTNEEVPGSVPKEIFYIPDGQLNALIWRLSLEENEQLDKPLDGHDRIKTTLEQLTRDGRPDWRAGKDATSEQIVEEFGFNGVTYGDWVKKTDKKTASERQMLTNHVFDALADLADILGIERKAIGFYGRMTLGIGATGSGKYAAHFAHGGNIQTHMNFTKTKGDGSVAHEWMHAFDYFSHAQMGEDNYPDAGPPGHPFLSTAIDNLKNTLWHVYDKQAIHKKLHSFFALKEVLADKDGIWHSEDGFLNAKVLIDKYVAGSRIVDITTLYMRQAVKLDKGKFNKYFSKKSEMFARAFEAYIYDKLKEKDQTSEYLVNMFSADEYAKPPRYLGYVFPSDTYAAAGRYSGDLEDYTERSNFNALFDGLFSQLSLKPEGKLIKSLDLGRWTGNNDVVNYARSLQANDYAELRALYEKFVEEEVIGVGSDIDLEDLLDEEDRGSEQPGPDNIGGIPSSEGLPGGPNVPKPRRPGAGGMAGGQPQPGGAGTNVQKPGEVKRPEPTGVPGKLRGGPKRPTVDPEAEKLGIDKELGDILDLADDLASDIDSVSDVKKKYGDLFGSFDPEYTLTPPSNPDIAKRPEQASLFGLETGLEGKIKGAEYVPEEGTLFTASEEEKQRKLEAENKAKQTSLFNADLFTVEEEKAEYARREALDILDEYYKNDPRGKKELEASLRADDQGDFTRFIFQKTQLSLKRALEEFPKNPSQYYARKEDTPAEVLASQLYLTSPWNHFQLTDAQLADLKQWISKYILPRATIAEEQGKYSTDRKINPEVYAKFKPTFQNAYDKYMEQGVINREEGVLEDPRTPESFREFLHHKLIERGQAKVAPYLDQFISELESLDEALQVRNISVSKGIRSGAGGALAPKNIAKLMTKAVEAVEAVVGPVDDFVASRLGFSKEFLYGRLYAEQIDAIALAIYNMDKGMGIIVGDQTGFGKGRVAASLIHEAIQRGKKPIFFTLKPKLFSDMYARDLKALGSQPRVLVIHEEDIVEPYFDEATGEEKYRILVGGKGPKELKELSGATEKVTTDDRGNKVVETKINVEKLQKSMEQYDAIFVPYSQIQAEDITVQKAILAELAKDNTIIMDESHEASGESNRGDYIKAIQETAASVTYLSATYAKTPLATALYSKTSLGQSNMSLQELTEAVKVGGPALQAWIARNLAELGQMVRRELDYSGVQIEQYPDELNRARDLALVDSVNVNLRSIVDLDGGFQMAADNLQAKLNIGLPKDTKIYVRYHDFKKVSHNIAQQSLLALKAPALVQMSLDKIRAGEKVLINLSNTMEAPLKWMLDNGILKEGEKSNVSFNDILKRGLTNQKKAQIVVVVAGHVREKYYHTFTDDELDIRTRQEYYSLLNQLQTGEKINLPVSPIDYMRNALEKEGIATTEITNRGFRIFDDGTVTRRTKQEKNQNRIIDSFNNGKYDFLVFNGSGSTGVSLHAAPQPPNDGKRRVMIIAQPDYNITTFVQALGRIFRQGQIPDRLPSYIMFNTAVPSEKRPAALLIKKLKSLNAQTTADTESALSLKDFPDMNNAYGSHVIAQILYRNSTVNNMLWVPLDFGKRKRLPNGEIQSFPDDFRKVTNRIQLMPSALQEDLYEEIQRNYEAYIDLKKQLGEYNLDSKHVDLKAKTLTYVEAVPAQHQEGKPSPFTDRLLVEKVQTAGRHQPHNAAKIMSIIERNHPEAVEYLKEFDAEKRNAYVQKMMDKLAQRAKDHKNANPGALVANLVDRLQAKVDALMAKGIFNIGDTFNVPFSDAETIRAVLIDVKIEQTDGIPNAPSKIKLIYASSDTNITESASFSIPASNQRVEQIRTAHFGVPSQWDTEYRKTAAANETRYIFTGNILEVFRLSPKVPGQIVNFTRHDNSVDIGYLVPKAHEADVIRNYFGKPIPIDALAFHEICKRNPLKAFNADKGHQVLWYPTGNCFIFSHPTSGKIPELEALARRPYQFDSKRGPREKTRTEPGKDPEFYSKLFVEPPKIVEAFKLLEKMGIKFQVKANEISDQTIQYTSKTIMPEAPTFYPQPVLEKMKKEGTTIHALGITLRDELTNKAIATFIGKTINSTDDIADLAQLVRDPKMETLRFFGLDANKKIVAESAISSRVPGSVAISSLAMHTALKKMQSQSANIVSFIMSHNHPSGVPAASGPDKQFTQALARQLPILYHVVTDHEQYSVIHGNGDTELKPVRRKSVYNPLKPTINHSILGKTILGSDEIANIAMSINGNMAGNATVIHLDSMHKVRAIETVPVGWLKTNKMRDHVIARQQEWGAARTALVFDSALGDMSHYADFLMTDRTILEYIQLGRKHTIGTQKLQYDFEKVNKNPAWMDELLQKAFPVISEEKPSKLTPAELDLLTEMGLDPHANGYDSASQPKFTPAEFNNLKTSVRPEDPYYHLIQKDYFSLTDGERKIVAELLNPSEIAEPTAEYMATTYKPSFMKWFEGSEIVDEYGQPQVYYHATKVPTVFETFQPGESAGSGENAVIFVTPSTSFANSWIDQYITEADQYEEREMGKMLPRIMPLFVKAKNVWDYENPDHIKLVSARAKELLDNSKYMQYSEELRKEMVDSLSTGNWGNIEFLNYLGLFREFGFDGFYVLEYEKNLAVYSSNQLKSAIGNSGAFNAYTGSVVESPIEKYYGGWVKPNRIAVDDPISIDPEVDKRRRAAYGIGKASFISKMRDYVTNIFKGFTRRFVELDPKKLFDGKPVLAQVMDIFRRAEDIVPYSRKIAAREVQKFIGNLSEKERLIFGNILLYEDLLKDVRNDLYTGELPFGHKDAAQVEQYLNAYQLQSNEKIDKAIEARNAYLGDLRKQMVEEKILPESVLNDDRYFHHQVLKYYAVDSAEKYLGTMGAGEDLRNKKKGFQLARKGSKLDYNTNWMESEFEVIQQAIHSIETAKVLKEIRDVSDIADRLKLEAKQTGGNWKELIPEGYSIWQPEKGNWFFRTFNLTEKVTDDILQSEMGQMRQQILIEMSKKIGKRKAKKMARELAPFAELMDDVEAKTILAMGKRKPEWVLPNEVIKTLNNFHSYKEENAFGKFTVMALNSWKQWTLLNPFRIFKYMFNNASGDLDIVLAYDPKILRFAKEAAVDLWKYNRGTLSAEKMAELDQAMKYGVIASGITITEIPEINESGMFKLLSGNKQVGGYWKTVKDFSTWRENILRLAAFRSLKERMLAGETNIYAASKQSEVNAISDPIKRAAKVARELIGDYGNISDVGNHLRRHWIPFYSWMEINAPRYVRLFKNLSNEGKSPGMAAGVLGWKTAKLGIKATALYAIIMMWNQLFFGDEDEELKQGGTKGLQLILGRTAEGKIITVRFQGALSDALSWFGLQDFPQDYKDLVSGKKSWEKQWRETWQATPNRLVSAARPLEKTIGEIISGKTIYPDMFKPRPIHDKLEHAFRTLSLDIPYKYAAGKPMKGKTFAGHVGETAIGIFGYKSDAREGMYYDTLTDIRDFLEENGEQMPGIEPTDRSNALYYYKQAKKYGDTEAMAKYRKEYLSLGGKPSGLLKSARKSDPIAFIPIKFRRKYFNQLTEGEKEKFAKAREWWKETYVGGGEG